MLNQKTKSKAFTIVELLTVISVITLIIGLLVPALNKVNRMAKNMKQKAQFHSITTSLEMFRSENEEYPASAQGGTSGSFICGAQKLAEALVGRDLQGLDPLSDRDNPDITTNNPYGLTGPQTVDATKLTTSLERRKGPYLNTDNLPVFDIAQIYALGANPTGNVYPGALKNDGTASTGNPAPVITDIYKSITISVPVGSTGGKKSVQAGTPVLYYKANIAQKFNDTSSNTTITTSSIYNIYDNDEIVQLCTIKDPSILHKIDTRTTTTPSGIDTFYGKITNNIASANLTASSPNLTRPYRPDSYILISAGFDGIYGTDDDITNYEE